MRQTFTEPIHPDFSRWQVVINVWIFIACLTLALETVKPFASGNASLFYWVEITAVAFFALDYLGNLYFAPNRIKYMFSFWGLVDLVSILPTVLMILNLTFFIRCKGLSIAQGHSSPSGFKNGSNSLATIGQWS